MRSEALTARTGYTPYKSHTPIREGLRGNQSRQEGEKERYSGEHDVASKIERGLIGSEQERKEEIGVSFVPKDSVPLGSV